MTQIIADTVAVLDFGASTMRSNPRLAVPVTLLKGSNPRPLRHITLGELIAEIETTDVSKLNDSQSLICAYEHYLQNVQLGISDPKKAYNAKKDALKGFLFGNYSHRANEKNNCLEYVPCLVFDLDACQSTYDCFLFQNKLKNLDYVFAAFASPSGYGLRILVWTTATYETHRMVYQQIINELCKELKITTDKNDGVHMDATCQNESRHFYYVAIDQKAFYLNLESKIFDTKVLEPQKEGISSRQIPKLEHYTYIDAITDEVKIDFILKTIDMKKPRKLQCFDFGCLCCENNVDFNKANHAAQQHFYDSEQQNPEKVITTQLKDAYEQTKIRYTDAQFANFLYKMHHIKVLNKTYNDSTQDNTVSANIKDKPQAAKDKKPNKSIYRIVEKKLQKHYEIRYNTITREIEIRKLHSKQEFLPLEDRGIHNLLRFLADDDCVVSQKTLETSLFSDFSPQYNPIELYFETLPVWDVNTDYIKLLCNYVVAKDQEWFERMFRKMLVRCVACGLGKTENKHCFVLFGGQHNGKTSFLRYLCPPFLEKYRKENFKSDKDGIISLGQNFSIILEELDKLKKEDWDALKAIFSMDYTKERPPFGRLPVYFQRIANFFGTCNKKEFLTDETGTVRWLVMEIIDILHDEGAKNGYKSVNIDMVWAQAYLLFKNGFKFQLTKEDIAYSEAQNQLFKHVYIEKELVNQYYEVPNDENMKNASHQTSANILIHLQKVSSLNNLKLANIRKALIELGFSEIFLKNKGRGYMIFLTNS
jgi:predicted P-loop ATPase